MKQIEPGDQLDHYSIQAFVARGGMASLFRGTDERTGRPVAIKVPHPEVECDPVFFERFRRESEIGRTLEHPGILRVLPAIPGRTVYMAAEWVEGQTLRQVLDAETKIAPERALRIAVSICYVLDYLTANGIAHRDLKPENIILGPASETEQPVTLIDFGLASKRGARRLTFGKFSRIMGSVDYVSPEQLKGKRGEARSDIYALGVILCEMLTGRVPFENDNPLVAMNRRLTAAPSLEGVPRALRESISCALERDPALRYSSAGDFADDLRNPKGAANASLARQRPPAKKAVLFSLAMIPAALFLILLYVAQQQ